MVADIIAHARHTLAQQVRPRCWRMRAQLGLRRARLYRPLEDRLNPNLRDVGGDETRKLNLALSPRLPRGLRHIGSVVERVRDLGMRRVHRHGPAKQREQEPNAKHEVGHGGGYYIRVC